tara:strand:+ start:13 stop:1065 length:1053 start_codon:yes stop_codon:yes gene_type:complete
MAAYTTIDDAGLYFNPILFTGTGGSLAVTGVGFQPDLVWQKNRSITSNHLWTDAVRGTDSQIYCSSTSAEGTLSTVLTSFDSDGFTAGTNSDFNGSGNDIVTWNWKAGTTTGIAGSPSITPTGYSFNQTSGFSIIEYTGNGTSGATIPHGLSAAPECVICKSTTNAEAWITGHKWMNSGTTPWNYGIELNASTGDYASAGYWNDTAPSSTLVTLGSGGGSNLSGGTVMAYCFAPIKGYSKFGSYTGNGNADGPFIFTGFSPAFILAKRTDSTGNWFIWDNKRKGYNANNNYLMSSTTGAESDATNISILSNGFKFRSTDADLNASGGDYIYLAFAEAPLANSEGVAVNAR